MRLVNLNRKNIYYGAVRRCDSNNGIQHYGVKGMKWGVRHDKKAGANYVRRKGDITLNRGTKFQRIATSSNSGYTKGVYASYRNSDKDLYKGVLGRMRISHLLRQNENVTLTEISAYARININIPSKKTRIDEFNKLYQNDPKGVMDLINYHEKTRYGHREMRTYSPNSVARNKHKNRMLYEKFNDSLALGVDNKHGGAVIQRYYDQLQSKGYHAIPDENDIRIGKFKAKAPLIIFDTSVSIGKTKTRELTPSEIYGAYNRSIGKKMVRSTLYRNNFGIERLRPDSKIDKTIHRKLEKNDKKLLNENYTMNDLATDWSKNGLTSRQIKRVSSYMDSGYTHDEAIKQTKKAGNKAVAKVLGYYGL